MVCSSSLAKYDMVLFSIRKSIVKKTREMAAIILDQKMCSKKEKICLYMVQTKLFPSSNIELNIC